MNEEMEDELTKLSEINSKTDYLVVTEEENIDEVIPIDLRKERNTKAYKQKMITDIERIKRF